MSPRDRRALVLGAGVAAAAFLGLRGLPWAVREARVWRERTAARRELLLGARLEIRDALALDDSVAAVEKQLLSMASAVLAGNRQADAAADLVGRINAVAARERVRLVRTAVLPDTACVVRLGRVTVRASFEGDARGALGLLARLEAEGSPFTVADARLTALDPASVRTAPEVLAGEIVVRGWYMARPLSATAQ